MANRIDDQIRSFGMSGYMLSDDLRAIEQRYQIELGHGGGKLSESPVDYYPQFEQSVRSEASAMARHYELFYCLEQSIRKLISDTLSEAAGDDWWKSGRIPANIVRDVEARIQKETDSGISSRSDNDIDYTTFGELSVIITSNWDLFTTILNSPKAVERVMSSLNLLRGSIAHCCPLSDDEVIRLNLAVRDWFRMIS